MGRFTSGIDIDRLARIVDSIGTELSDPEFFASINRAKYLSDRHFAASQTYGETSLRLSAISEFAPGDPKELAAFSKLRNLPAHEYLDPRYPPIEDFVLLGPPLFRRLCEAASRIVR